MHETKEKVVKLYNDYAKIIPEAMYETKQGTGLKILTPKQILLQRLPIAISQVTASKTQKMY